MIFIYFLFIFTFFLQKALAGKGGSTVNFKSDSKGLRLAQRNMEKIKNDKLLNYGINSSMFFKELGQTGKCGDCISSVIDDVHGASNISKIFMKLYIMSRMAAQMTQRT